MGWSGTISFVIERDGADLELEVEGQVSSIVPGKYTGPPENCYPDEGGDVDILSVKLNGVEYEDLNAVEVGLLEDLLYKTAEAHQRCVS